MLQVEVSISLHIILLYTKTPLAQSDKSISLIWKPKNKNKKEFFMSWIGHCIVILFNNSMDQTDHEREGSALQDFGILKNARKHELGPWGGLTVPAVWQPKLGLVWSLVQVWIFKTLDHIFDNPHKVIKKFVHSKATCTCEWDQMSISLIFNFLW